MLADYVTMDTGTGVVHTAPSHGAEDFMTGQKYRLDATSNVDKAGIMRNGLPEYEGKRVLDANAPIIDLVKAAARCCIPKRWSIPIPTAGAVTTR